MPVNLTLIAPLVSLKAAQYSPTSKQPVPINKNDLSNGNGGIWVCDDWEKGPCGMYQSSFRYSTLELPPNRWHTLVAWAAFKLRGLGESEFGKVTDRDSVVFYPHEYAKP